MKRALIYVLLFVLAIGGLLTLRMFTSRGVATTQPATQPATTQAATQGTAVKPPTQEKKLVDLLDLVLADNPDYPTTQPLELPADLQDAGKIVLNRPTYLDPLGRLWITHPQGRDVDELLRKSLRGSTFIVRQQPAYVYYPMDGTDPFVFLREPDNKITMHVRRRSTVTVPSLGGADWSRATYVGQEVVVPTATGATLLNSGVVTRQIGLSFPQKQHTQPVVLSTLTSLLVWSPWENGRPGSTGGVFFDGKRELKLDASTGWFDKLIQLVPLADGSVLAVGQGEKGIELKLAPLDKPAPLSPQIAEKVTTLGRKLADRDPRVRAATQRELEAMGPAIYPQLESMRPKLPVEAQIRIQQILGQRFKPKLAGLDPLPGLVHVVSRFRDGGCVLLLTGGGTDDDNGLAETVIPAWVSIRPGRFVERLPNELVSNLVVGRHQLQAAANEWVLIDPDLGARRWLGSRMQTLLPKDLRKFDKLIGIDAARRWVFRSSTEPGKTLLLDPSLPDITPKFPVWKIDSEAGVGWTSAGWPAVKRQNRVFVLDTRNWRMLDASSNESFDTKPPALLPTTATDSHGRRLEWNNGTLTITGQDGTARQEPINAPGATAIFFTANRLFLVAPGKVYRQRIPDGDKPLPPQDATFTGHLPPGEMKRVWLDPAGRIIFAHDTTLWIAFPEGRIHPDVAKLILNRTEDAN